MVTNPRRVGRNLSSLVELASLEQLLVLLDVEIVGTWQVSAASQFECKFRVVECRQDVRNDRLFINVHAQNLALLVNTDETLRCLVFSRNEDGFARDSIHVDAGTGFEVVQMDETIFGDEIDDAVSF